MPEYKPCVRSLFAPKILKNEDKVTNMKISNKLVELHRTEQPSKVVLSDVGNGA